MYEEEIPKVSLKDIYSLGENEVLILSRLKLDQAIKRFNKVKY